MRLHYIANIRLPTEKAHGIQIMKMCEAFADLGHEVELVVPNRNTPIADDPFDYYRVRRNFKVRRLWCLDTVKWGRFGFLLESFTFAEAAAWYVLSRSGIFYTRDELVALYLRLMGKKVVWEAHMGQQSLVVRLLLRLKVPLVVITQGLKDLYTKLGIPSSSIHVSPDGVDIEQFDIKKSKDEAREELHLPSGQKIVLYTGHLYSWKGADSLAEAGKYLDGLRVLFVGGTEKDIEAFKNKYGSIPAVEILGKKPHHQMPMYLRAADLLVIPNSAKEDISKLYTSPMKLFEYMASGTPIVASDLPSLREIISEKEALFANPDDPVDLARTIKEAFESYGQAKERAAQARNLVSDYSWKERARKILEFLR